MPFILRPARSGKEKVRKKELSRLEEIVLRLGSKHSLKTWKELASLSSPLSDEARSYVSALRIIEGVQRKQIQVIED